MYFHLHFLIGIIFQYIKRLFFRFLFGLSFHFISFSILFFSSLFYSILFFSTLFHSFYSFLFLSILFYFFLFFSISPFRSQSTIGFLPIFFRYILTILALFKKSSVLAAHRFFLLNHNVQFQIQSSEKLSHCIGLIFQAVFGFFLAALFLNCDIKGQ